MTRQILESLRQLVNKLNGIEKPKYNKEVNNGFYQAQLDACSTRTGEGCRSIVTHQPVSVDFPAWRKDTIRCSSSSHSAALKQSLISCGANDVVNGDCSSGIAAMVSGRR